MSPLRLRERWMPLPWGVYGLIIAVIMAAVGIYCEIYYPEEKPSVRVAVPMYGLAVYWVIALLLNRQTTVVTPQGIRVTVWPFFIRPPQRMKREKIRHCYIRRVEIFDEGTMLESYYSAGVEALDGEQVDVATPVTAEVAKSTARQIADVLNQAANQTPVGVEEVGQLQRKALPILILAGSWLALFIGSIFVGFAWELSLQ